MRQEFDRAEDRYNQDIERLTERLQNVQFQYEKARAEKEKIELQSLKLNRDLERVTLDLDELRAQRGLEQTTNMEDRKGKCLFTYFFNFSLNIKDEQFNL